MNGILLVDKPAGWTSNDVVQKLRGILHERRVGHAGTLDPMATGLLTVFVGRATRAVAFAEGDRKRYEAAFRPGLVTDTQDITGTPLREAVPVSAGELARSEGFRSALQSFVGEQKQIPPMYSAVKVNGQRLYQIARRGGSIEREPRDITIFDLRMTGFTETDILLDVACSKGTYIRTLCHDLGEKLGCGGCLSALRRTEAGRFRVEEARTLGQIQEGDFTLLPVDSLFADYPAYRVNSREEKRVRNGGGFHTQLADGFWRLYAAGEDGACGEEQFLALGRAEQGELHIIKSFFEV